MKRKHIILIVINGISLLFFAIMTIAAVSVKNSLPDQQTVGRWTDGNSRYAQVSVFTEASSAMSVDGIFTARVDIEKKLVENSLTSEKANARVWVDAFSADYGKLSVSSDYGKTETQTIVTGGDFFLFHPIELVSGYYYSEDNLMQDRILIDEVLAWQLYGATDIAGKPVLIESKYFYIAGVYKSSENSDIEKVTNGTPMMFMPYQGYEILGKTPSFDCYEACLPNPVTGLAEMIVTEAVPVKDINSEVVENSSRYSLKNRFDIIRDFGMRSVKDNAIVYPYWENAARITEDKSALMLVFQLLGLIIPICTAFAYVIIGYRKRKVFFNWFANAVKSIFNKLLTKIKNRKAGIADE
ncbi:MAG: ABC transporter permease [Oscillospiraceae bacterium]|nr:ABC transporter permease [Oscillospiraceae bacterium]